MPRRFARVLVLLCLTGFVCQAKPRTIFDCSKELQLSSQQQATLKGLLGNFRSEMQRQQQSLMTQEKGYRKLLEQQAELTLVRNSLKSIQQTRVSLRLLDLSTQRELEKVLSEKQMQQWGQIQSSSRKSP